LLDSFRKGQRWLTLIFVSVIGLVFVFFLGVGGSFGPSTPTGNAVVELDDMQLTSRDLAREKTNTEARLRRELGDAYDQLGADRYVASQALGTMINTVVLAAAAEDMGLRVTQEELRRMVQNSSAFVDQNGRFSPEAFDRFASYNYGSQRAFIRSFTRDLLGQKLAQLLVGQTQVSDAEVDLRTRYELEDVRIAYVSLDASVLPAGLSLDNAEIETYAQTHEPELRALFAERQADLSEPERIRARHILMLAPENASKLEVTDARARAMAALERIAAGEDFASVAQEVSEDVATAQVGGDLGLFARGENDAAFEDAAFALEAGTLSDVVRSTYGFHVIRIDEKQPAKPASFDDHRFELARELATRAQALERADRQSEALATAIESGASLEEAAREAGLNLERTPSLKRRPDGFVPGLGPVEDVLATAFALEAGQSSSEIFELPDRRIMIQVLERNSPSAEQVISERLARRDKVLLEKQNQIIQGWLDDYRSQLETSGRLRINAELALGT
jgi:peptidyl-prolyl cis-trans isomerase D